MHSAFFLRILLKLSGIGFRAKLCFSLNTSVGLLMCLGWITPAYPWNKMVLSAGRLQFCKFNKRSVHICEVVFDIPSLLTLCLYNQNRHSSCFSKQNRKTCNHTYPSPAINSAHFLCLSFTLISEHFNERCNDMGRKCLHNIPAINYVCCQPYFLPFQPLCGSSASLHIYIKQIHIHILMLIRII